MDYTRVPLAEISRGLLEVADDAERTFAALDATQVNWKPAVTQWSVGQCLDHLLTTNGLMFEAMNTALDSGSPRTIWQRLPFLAGVLGPLMVRSLSPEGARKFKAPVAGQPAASAIAADVVSRFAAQQREAAARTGRVDQQRAAATIMTSPFSQLVSYSVLDGWRLIFAHDRRHVEQARRVMQLPQFPGRSVST